jgi:hypothetical protein
VTVGAPHCSAPRTGPGGSFLVRYETSGGIAAFSKTLTVDRHGGAVLVVAQGKQRTHRFRLGAAALAALESNLVAARLATLAPCYGDVFPDEIATTVESPAYAVVIMEAVPGPARLRPLLARLAAIAKAHGG